MAEEPPLTGSSGRLTTHPSKTRVSQRQKTPNFPYFLPGEMGLLELGEGVYGIGLDTVRGLNPCADISLKYLRDTDQLILICHKSISLL